MTADKLSKNRKVVRSRSLGLSPGVIDAIDDVVAKRDNVGCRHRTTGEGVRGHPATGEAIEAKRTQSYRIEDGRAPRCGPWATPSGSFVSSARSQHRRRCSPA